MAIVYSRRAARDVRKLPHADARRLRTALEHLARDDTEGLDIKALTGASPHQRLRVGDWRVLYRPLTPDDPAT